MRLTEGFTRIWSEDVDRLFAQSPKDFAMFYYLLANCHYKEKIYWKTIKGKTYDKKDYVKEWGIEKGDYLGSKSEIKAFWKYDNRTQKTIFASMSEKGLIEVLLEDPALIVRIKNYPIWSWRGKSKERPQFPHESKKEEQKNEAESNNEDPLCNITDPPMSYDIPPYVIRHTPPQCRITYPPM